MDSFSWSILIGGITFFFFGLSVARKELQLVSGDRLRQVIGAVSNNRFKAFGLGAAITFLLQSSGATSVVLISLADTHLITLFQAIAILLGADFGTTLVVILLSIKRITEISLFIVAVGFFVQLIAKQRRMVSVGAIILSFGLIFYGMQLMIETAAPLKSSPVAAQIFAYLAKNPIASLIISVLLAGTVHSAGVIGIAIALALAGTISFEASVPIVLGANVGTCVTALLAAVNSGIEGKRVAIAHTVAKIIGVAIVFPLIGQFVYLVNIIAAEFLEIVPEIGIGLAGKIVIAHILFNVLLALLLIPFVGLMVRLVRFILPTPPIKEEKVFGPLYLDKASLDTPALAFAHAKMEVLRIASIAYEMFNDCLKMFSRGVEVNAEIEKMQSQDDKIDVLDKAVRFYLSELSAEKLLSEQTQTALKLLSTASDLEEIGDALSKELVMLAKKKAAASKIFSDEGWKDLRDFQQTVGENFNLTISILTQPSEELAIKVIRHEEEMDALEQQLRQAHLNRLQHGLKESFSTSSLHLDILGILRRINSKLCRIVRVVMR